MSINNKLPVITHTKRLRVTLAPRGMHSFEHWSSADTAVFRPPNGDRRLEVRLTGRSAEKNVDNIYKCVMCFGEGFPKPLPRVHVL